MDNLSLGLIAACAIVCLCVGYFSWLNANKNIVDNGAQHVVTIGVLCTFLGIAYALYHFDTNTENMLSSIDIFLGSMKFAFVTSIIGMGAGLVIKAFQWKVTKTESNSLKENFVAVNEINNSTKINVELLRNILAEVRTSGNSQVERDETLKNILAEVRTSGNSQVERDETLKNILTEIRESNNSKLGRELGKFTATLENFMSDMKKFSASMNEQSRMLEQLSTTLTESIDNFGTTQAARLDAMKSSIEQMQSSTAQSEKNSAALLDATKNFQTQALDNDDKQMKILSDNTAQIVTMKNSFDSFMQDVAKNFSENFIAALNESIKDLNAQLQEQFGDNFKELNAAVREVVNWQREYKQIVTTTTDELKLINEIFTRFVEQIQGELNDALQTFAATSEKNISVQKNLAAASAQLSTIIEHAAASVNQMQLVTEKFGKFSDDVLKKNLSLLQSHLDNLAQLEKNFAAEVKNINGVAFKVAADTEQYLKNFNNASKNSMQVISETIAKYKADLNKETEESLSKLHQLFKAVAENTDKQSGKAIEKLAGALAEVSGQMVGNYKVLVSKIAEVDALLDARRQLK